MLEDSSFVARRLATFHWLLCAAPAYISRHGEPRSVEDLAQHSAVGYTHFSTGRTKDWDFVVNGETVTTRMSSNLIVNDADGYLICGLQGLGLIRPPSYLARSYLQSGHLCEILAPFKGPPVPLSVIYAHGRLASLPARALFDWLTQTFAKSPLLE